MFSMAMDLGVKFGSISPLCWDRPVVATLLSVFSLHMLREACGPSPAPAALLVSGRLPAITVIFLALGTVTTLSEHSVEYYVPFPMR